MGLCPQQGLTLVGFLVLALALAVLLAFAFAFVFGL